MKNLFISIIIALFITTVPLSAQQTDSRLQTDRVVCIAVTSPSPDLTELNKLLSDGWTVKHQTEAGRPPYASFMIFTLEAPSRVRARAEEEETHLLLEETASSFAKQRIEKEKNKQVKK